MAQSTRRSNGRGNSYTTRSARRKRVWFFSEGAHVHTGADNMRTDLLAAARASLDVGGFPGWTLETIIGQIYTELTVPTVLQVIDTRYGILPAFQSAGAVNIPVPYTDEADFLWTDTNFRTLTTVAGSAFLTVQREVRTGAKRKLEEVEDTLFMVTRQNSVSDVIIRWRLRILLLAP